jgi:hypothetical protein
MVNTRDAAGGDFGLASFLGAAKGRDNCIVVRECGL